MFKNRKITVTMDKVDKKQEPTDSHEQERAFEEKVIFVTAAAKDVAKRVFIGVCIYVILDTHRQVSVARASNQKI